MPWLIGRRAESGSPTVATKAILLRTDIERTGVFIVCNEEYQESRVWISDAGIVRCPFLTPLAKTVFQVLNYHRDAVVFDLEQIYYESNCTADEFNIAFRELQQYGLFTVQYVASEKGEERGYAYFDLNDAVVNEYARASKPDSYNSYGYEWPWLRIGIMRRDKYTCQLCKKHSPHGYFDVHHIVKYKECQEHNPDNLITLCRSCHKRIEDKPEILKQILSGELTFEEFTKPKPRKRGIPAKKRKPKKKVT